MRFWHDAEDSAAGQNGSAVVKLSFCLKRDSDHRNQIAAFSGAGNGRQALFRFSQ